MDDILAQVHAKIGAANLPIEAVARLSLARQSAKQSDVQPVAVQRVAMLGNSQGNSHVLLFKGFQGSPRAIQDLLEAYGELILLNAGPAGAEIWDRKLTLAEDLVAADFNTKLQTKSFSTFRSLVESFSGAVTRLVAVHLANALIHHRVAFGDAFNIDVRTWPHTSGLATGQVPYSIVPLVSAYCDQDVWRSFPVAFSRRVLGTLTCGRSDVLLEFKNVIDAVCEAN